MKNLSITSMLLLLNGFFQFSIAQATFERLYGGLDNDAGHSIMECSTGGFLVCGYTTNYLFEDTDLYLLRLTVNGDTIWTHTYPKPVTWEEITRNIERRDHTYLVSNWCYSDSTYFSLHNIDDSGYEHWCRDYRIGDYSELNSIVNVSDGGVALTGTVGWYQNKMFILKTDSLGTEEWLRTYSGNYYEDYHGTSVIETLDGGFLTCGYKEISSGLDGTLGILAKTNATGDSVWEKTYPGVKSDTRYFMDVIQKPDGSYLLTGVDVEGFIEYVYYPFLMKVVPDGTVLWTRYLTQGMLFRHLSFQASGDIVLTGDYDDSVYLGRADSMGYMTWSASMGSKYMNPIFYHTIPLFDGGFLMTGRVSTSSGLGGQDVLVMKADEYGLITRLDEANSADNEFVLRVWPNPCSESLNIRCPSQIHSLTIIDARGQSIYYQKSGFETQTGDYSLSIGFLPKGLFLVSCETASGTYSKRIIKL